MKLIVVFGAVRVIVPCGNGELTVRDLTERAISRYRKATNKHPDDHIQVQVLETSEDQGILDPDDTVCDVVDDRDKLIAIFEERPASGPVQNELQELNVSTPGRACPDIFQVQSSHIHEDAKNIKMFPIVRDILESEENKEQTSSPKRPPQVAPKPQAKKGPRTSFVESTPSEDSGIFQEDRIRMGSDSSKSEGHEILYSPPTITTIKTSETAFVAVATRAPIQSNVAHFTDPNERGRLSSASSGQFEVDQESGHSDEEESFGLGRNTSRKSMFVDSPMLDRWAELQEQRMYEMSDSDRTPAMSPSEERHYDQPDFGSRMEDAGSESSGESGFVLIELEPENPGDLGVTVFGYKTADGRELGLIVQDITADGCAGQDGRLQVADQIVEVNGQSLVDLTNEQAESQFAAAVRSPVVSLGISRSHSFVPDLRDTELNKEESHSCPVEEPRIDAEQEPVARRARSSTLEKLAGIRTPSPTISTAPPKKVNKRVLLELTKGSSGLGFSITTRDNPAGGNAPIFIKSILAKGAAIEDGRLKAGDRILEVNGTRMTGKSQAEAVNILRGTKGVVKLVVQREEEVAQPSPQAAVELKEESFAQLRDEGRQILTFKIALDVSGAAGLGVSVKGKTRGPGTGGGRDSPPEEQGIFVKSVLSGGAAAKDRRLQPDDQLLQVNGASLVRMPNAAAMNTLRQAMQSTMPGQAFIEVVVAREPEQATEPSVLQQSNSLEALNTVGRERPIEALAEGPRSPLPPPEQFAGTEEVDGKKEELREKNDQGDEDDEFSAEPVHLNFVPARDRNAVKRNDSYCVAVNKTVGSPYSPLSSRNRVEVRPSPLAGTKVRMQARAMENGPAMSASTPAGPRSVYARLTEGVTSSTPTTIYVPAGRPTSTVAVPTPPVGSTKGAPPRYGATPPQPPPRWDSACDTSVEQRLIQHLAAKGELQNDPKSVTPPPPRAGETSEEKCPPSYEEALVHSRRPSRPSESSDGGRSSKEELSSWVAENPEDDNAFVPESPDLPGQNPFSREGFGRQSMSEKRGRGTLDAKQSEFYIKREQNRSNESVNSSQSNEASPRRKSLPKLPLQKAHSSGRPVHQNNNGVFRMQKSISTGNLSLHSVNPPDKRVMSDDNISFTNEVEHTSRERDVLNGHARLNHSDEGQDEIPITMTSNAAFNDVQQKLTKKPFYKGISSVFKIGKGRRGDYNLTDNDSAAVKHTYTREALIDFPAEQRYRQLVHNYGQESEAWRSRTLPTRGHHKKGGKNNGGKNPPPEERIKPVKIGRITVTEPTRV